MLSPGGGGGVGLVVVTLARVLGGAALHLLVLGRLQVVAVDVLRLRLDVNLLIVLLLLLLLLLSRLRLSLGLGLRMLSRELDYGHWALVETVVLRGGGGVVLARPVIQRRLGLLLLVSSMLLLGVMLLLLLLRLLIVSVMVGRDSCLLVGRRRLVRPGLVLSIAGCDHTLLSDGLRHWDWCRGLGCSVHRPRGARAGHDGLTPLSGLAAHPGPFF